MSDSSHPGDLAGTHNVSPLNDEVVRAGDKEIFGRSIEIARGRYREDDNWKNQRGPFGAFFLEGGPLQTHVVGKKDGDCILQGTLISGQRLAKNVTKNYLMMFDHDNGEPLDVIQKKIEDAGLFAVLWTTFNHMQTSTLIAEDALDKWRGKNGGKVGDATVEQAIEYLKETKKTDAAVFAAGCTLKKDFQEGGVKYVLTHAPMARVRSMFVLSETFDFAGRGTSQTAAIQEWKERYAGLAGRLGLTWDRSCVDPSRLMYLPRKAKDAPDGLHEIRVVPGKMLNINDIPRIATEAKGAKRDTLKYVRDAMAGKAAGQEGENGKFKTPGLLSFLRDNARDFEAASFCEDCDPDAVRNVVSDGKIEFRCPNDDGHSTQKANDRAFMAINASASDSGFIMACQHATCKDAANGDRAWYLDLLCEYYGKTVADLLEFCPAAERAEEKKQEEKSSSDAAIDALTPDVTGEQLDVILKEVAKRPDDGVMLDKIERISKKSGRSKGDILKMLKTHRKNAKNKQDDDDDNNSSTNNNPPEEGKEHTCKKIWSHWDYEDQCRVARARLIYTNETDPTVFVRPEGMVKLVERPLGLSAIPIRKKQQYQVALADCASFFHTSPRAGVMGVAPFNHVVDDIIGRDLGCFKPLDRIVRVPVFAPDGSLRIEKGYHPELQCYLDPRMTFRPVPDVVTDEDVAEAHYWLFEATRDFSFSDAFDGNEDLPVRDGTYDNDTPPHPMPNLERGASSRTNVYAAIMQGFMRNVIDGPTPIYAIDKPVAGEGAGFLADVISYILEGGRPFVGTMQENPEEFKKEIVATLLSSTNMAFYDNIGFKIDNPILASALTAGNFRGRILGLSQNADVPIRLLWIIAGKNLAMSAELMRRVVPIKIDSSMEHPERDRPMSYYKNYPLQDWLAVNRNNLVWACHVLGRNWFQKGCPSGSMQMESFGSYASVMGGVLAAAGITGFLENRERYLGEKSIDDDSEKNFVVEMRKRYPDQEIEMRLLADDLSGEYGSTVLSDLLGGIDLTKFSSPKQLHTKLGYHIRKYMSGRTYNIDGENFKLIIVGDRRPVKYRLMHIERVQAAV